MSTTKVLPRIGAAVGAVLAMLWVASPAYAADAVDASISQLASSLTAGARAPETFRTTLQNKTKAEIQPVRRVLLVRLPGIKPEHVRISQGRAPLAIQAAGTDEVRAVDPLQVRLGADGKALDSSRQDYAIQFVAGAPGGKAEVIFQAYRGTDLLGSTSKDLTIRGGAVKPSGTPTPSATTPEPETVADDPATAVKVNPLPDDQAQANVSDESSIPVALYVLGAILVGVGGVILWLLFRPRPALVAGPSQPVGPYPVVPPSAADRAPTLGYPNVVAPSASRQANTHPTTVMPTVRDPSSPPPPVDPWATQTGQSNDATRGFGPPRS